MPVPKATSDHYRQMQRLQTVGVLAARREWAKIDPKQVRLSWAARLPAMVAMTTALQVRAATEGASYGASTLAEQGTWTPPDAFVDPRGFGGYASDGRQLDNLLDSPSYMTLAALGAGLDIDEALRRGISSLERIMRTQIADAGRAAGGVDVMARPRVGYVRMVNLPSCGDCLLLAGRFYRWNEGFLRHPNCDCVHIPSAEAIADDVRIDPYAGFKSMTEAEQDRAFTKAGAEAIRDGADMYQVQNARRGRSEDKLTTTEGTTRRGRWKRAGGTGDRLTPEGIYSQKLSRPETLKLLEQNGYILPGGQVPGGSIRGDVEGFGQLGRGGARVGAREAVLEARRTGERTGSRATMTAAERRVHDSRYRYEQVLQGRNPYKAKQPLTPELSARAENEFRRWLAADGQIYTK